MQSNQCLVRDCWVPSPSCSQDQYFSIDHRPDQVQSNLGALPIAERLRGDPELLGRIMGETRQDSEAYWAERAALAWN